MKTYMIEEIGSRNKISQFVQYIFQAEDYFSAIEIFKSLKHYGENSPYGYAIYDVEQFGIKNTFVRITSFS